MQHKALIFLLAIFSTIMFGQTNGFHDDWKKILIYHSFDVTKKKENIPKGVFKKIVDTISEIANPREKWNSTCNSIGILPQVKLNWAAFTPDKTAWVVSVTRGGYSATTIYYLITSDEIEIIRNPGWKGESFKGFKAKYLADNLKKGSLY